MAEYHKSQLFKGITDLILLTVDVDKLPQREWDWLKQLKPMNPSPMMIATALLQHRGDNAAMNRLETLLDINSHDKPVVSPAAGVSAPSHEGAVAA